MQRITIFIFLFFIFTANLHAYEKPRIFVIPFEVGISRVPNDTAKEITDLFVSALIKSKSVEVIDAQKIENFSKDLDFEQILKIAKSAKSNKIFMGKINQVELRKNDLLFFDLYRAIFGLNIKVIDVESALIEQEYSIEEQDYYTNLSLPKEIWGYSEKGQLSFDGSIFKDLAKKALKDYWMSLILSLLHILFTLKEIGLMLIKKTDCVKIGQRMDVVRDAKQIKHPITQKTIYLPADSIATLEIREIGHEVSKAYIIEQDKKIKVGDKVMYRCEREKVEDTNVIFFKSSD
ncbi:hypothetical protein [Thermodesulfovibrio hydrogeniphilus]